MTVNYLAELNAFYDWLDSNRLPSGAVALWYVLMAINNRAGWPDEFTVTNLTLQAKTGLSRQQLTHYRNLLVQKGRLEYVRSGKVNEAGKYRLVRFHTQTHTQSMTQEHTQDETHTHTQSMTQERTQDETHAGHIIQTRRDEKKQEEIYKRAQHAHTRARREDEQLDESVIGDLARYYIERTGDRANLAKVAMEIPALLRCYSAEYIREKIDIVASRQGIRTPFAALIAALRDNWVPSTAPEPAKPWEVERQTDRDPRYEAFYQLFDSNQKNDEGYQAPLEPAAWDWAPPEDPFGDQTDDIREGETRAVETR